MAPVSARRVCNKYFGLSPEKGTGLFVLIGLTFWGWNTFGRSDTIRGDEPQNFPGLAPHDIRVQRHEQEMPGHKQPLKKLPPKPAPKMASAIQVPQPPPPAPPVATFYSEPNCKGKSVVVKASEMTADCGEDKRTSGCLDLCSENIKLDGKNIKNGVKSILVTGSKTLDLYQQCSRKDYWSSIYELDGCVNIYSWPGTSAVGFSEDSPLETPIETHKPQGAPSKFRVVYSAESSVYFAYQTQASHYSFEQNHQEGGKWTRLITARVMDDLGDQFPTYVARRHPFSRRYGPINKADVITKWLNSVDAPQEEVIVVIDPDNWFTGSIRPWVDKVKKGQAVAQAAFYAGSTVQVTKLWQIFCKKNCDFKLDMAAVPYLMHRDDWKEVAPLWKMYSIMIKEHMESHPGFEKQFPSLQVGWCAEMYGYVFGAAHAGVPHIIENRLQLRDVGPRLGPEVTKNVPFLHMGRIWFPKSYGCKKWCHTSGHEFDGYGMQVWCKCNTTASDVIPWPPAPGMDFVSAKTLEYLHDSREKYGPIPASKFRPDPYHGSLP
eukprot:m.120912 g.120912  ORF g.120912 m.120912 type:complete len:547 (+) comp17257_c0_seq5:127-1767(+)